MQAFIDDPHVVAFLHVLLTVTKFLNLTTIAYVFVMFFFNYYIVLLTDMMFF